MSKLLIIGAGGVGLSELFHPPPLPVAAPSPVQAAAKRNERAHKPATQPARYAAQPSPFVASYARTVRRLGIVLPAGCRHGTGVT